MSVLSFGGWLSFLATSTSLSVRGVAKQEHRACFPWERSTCGGGRSGFSWCLGLISSFCIQAAVAFHVPARSLSAQMGGGLAPHLEAGLAFQACMHAYFPARTPL